MKSPKKGQTNFARTKGSSAVNQNSYNKKFDNSFEDDPEEKMEEDPEEKHESIRQNKGLKVLSIIVKEIVKEKKLTTYKEVAEVIIRENLRFQNRGIVDSEKYKKAEQNIKRRVYDALNVLISASILVKEKKMVKVNDKNKRISINEKRNQINILNSQMVQLTRKQSSSQSTKKNCVLKI